MQSEELRIWWSYAGGGYELEKLPHLYRDQRAHSSGIRSVHHRASKSPSGEFMRFGRLLRSGAGVVTGTEAKSQRSGWRARLGRSRGCLPCKGRLGSGRPERAAGDEVGVEG